MEVKAFLSQYSFFLLLLDKIPDMQHNLLLCKETYRYEISCNWEQIIRIISIVLPPKGHKEDLSFKVK